MARWKWFAVFLLIAVVGYCIYYNYRLPPDVQAMGDSDLTAKIGFYAAIIGSLGATIDLISKIISIMKKENKK